MPTISIIIPVYNVEPYLYKCIDSILAQTFTDFECILIDDGSPDNCPAICDEYARKDSRIVVVHQKNAGVSVARNAGLDIAKGVYVCFVDSDDQIECDYCDILLKNINHADLAVCGVYEINSNKINKKEITIETIIYSKEQFFALFIKIRNDKTGDLILNYPCNKLYKIELLNKYSLRFDTTMSLGEDYSFNLEYLETINNVVLLHDILCYYRITSASLSRTVKIHNIQDLFKIADCTENFLKKINNYKIRHGDKKYIYSIYYTIVLINIILYNKIGKVSFLKNIRIIQEKLKIGEIIFDSKLMIEKILLLLIKCNIVFCLVKPVLYLRYVKISFTNWNKKLCQILIKNKEICR